MSSTAAVLRQTSLIRAAYGVCTWVAPNVIFRAFGLPAPEPDTRYLNATFGGRDFTVVAVTEAALRAGREKEALWVNASCEATDLGALLLEIRRRGGLDPVMLVGIGFNAFGWLSIARAARGLRR